MLLKGERFIRSEDKPEYNSNNAFNKETGCYRKMTIIISGKDMA
jgi:hypothetical protein